MKFRIRKEQFDFLSTKFKKEDIFDIDLELVPESATEALIFQQLEASAYHKGYHIGFKEGLYQGKKPELKYCMCGCGGNNCHLRICDKDCPLYNFY